MHSASERRRQRLFESSLLYTIIELLYTWILKIWVGSSSFSPSVEKIDKAMFGSDQQVKMVRPPDMQATLEMKMWALVPVKELNASKQRLTSVLSPAEREELMLAMLRDVLTAIQGVTVFDGLLLVSRSRKAQSLARDFVNDIFMESSGSDHSRAVTEGNRYLKERYGVDSSFAISADIPGVTSNDLGLVIEYHDRVTLVPDASGEGTNAVLASPPNALAYQFGAGSLKKHMASAEAAGISPSIMPVTSMAHDIDSPGDLEWALEDLPGTFTRDYLENKAIAARLMRLQSGQTVGFPQVRSTAWT